MQVVFLKRFSKDLDSVSNKGVRRILELFIEDVERSSTLKNHPNIKKLSGYKNAFRLRIGDYRVGMFISGDTVEFVRILHRKDIYKVFP
jgi:mRNA interferase RelE/StbE